MPDNPEHPIENDQTRAEPIDQQPKDVSLAERITRDHPDWPPLKLKFYFSSHDNVLDMPDLKNQLQNADIYLYEGVYGNTRTPFLQSVADADEPTDANELDYAVDVFTTHGLLTKGGADEAQFRALYGSKVYVGHIDLRPGDPIYDEMETTEKYEQGKFGFHEPTFNATIAKIKQRAEVHARFEEQREKIMVNRFEQEIDEILRAHPELKDKPGLKIVASMGAAHTRLYDKFKAEGIQSEYTLSEGHDSNDYWTQVNHTISSGQEPNRELLARVYLEDLMYTMINVSMAGKTVSTDLKFNYIVNCVSQFTAEEIESIHGMEQFSAEIFDDILRAKGLSPIPHNSEVLKTIVDSQKATQESTTAAEKATHPNVRPTQRD